ncbi:hypothetical protein ACFVUN_02515 [Kitasatospora griseola]|uniref:hypothetical protein n=1 Tax=Kitasatospora griseola TaxID=2064 RepID=UPI0036DC3EA1
MKRRPSRVMGLPSFFAVTLLGFGLIGGCEWYSAKQDHPDVTGTWVAGEERLEILPGGRLGNTTILESLCRASLEGSTAVKETSGGTWQYKELPSAGPGIEVVLPDFFAPGRACPVELLFRMSGEAVDSLAPTSGPPSPSQFRRQ